MKKKNVLSAIFLILILLIVSGASCQGRGKNVEEPTWEAFEGKEGLFMEFVKDSPKRQVYATYDSDLSVLVELENKGSYDTDFELYLTGFDPYILVGLDSNSGRNYGTMVARSTYQEGDHKFVEFTASSMELPEGVEVYKPTLLLSNCYGYKTIANPMVCIDPTRYGVSLGQKSCEVKDISMGEGQGAPVAVTRVKQTMANRKAIFNIEIENVGKGDVLRKGIGTKCPFDLNYEDINIIDYYVESSEGLLSNCKPENKVRLIDGKGRIFCTYTTSEDYTYPMPLRITLDYDYLDTETRDIEIIKAPE